MTSIKKITLDWSLAFLSAITVALILVLVLSYARHKLYPAITYNEDTSIIIPPVMRAGDTVKVCRDININRPVKYEVTRTLYREGTPTITADFGNAIAERNVAMLASQCRVASIPYMLPPGVWTLESVVRYKDWPFWDVQETAPEIKFMIVE